MKLSELKKDLEELDRLKALIENKVKKIYQKHGDLTISCVEEIIRRKGGDHSDGFLKTNLVMEFKDGQSWQVIPNYMKDGHLNNTIWRHNGIHAFDIKKINGKLPF
jgi:hypothetical protein